MPGVERTGTLERAAHVGEQVALGDEVVLARHSGFERHVRHPMDPMSPDFIPLREEDADPDPLRQFAAWFAEAGRAGVRMPEAVALATASADGAPSVRMVLMKGFDEHGFVFFSNYESRKGTELAANPRAALLFHWDPLGRQVRIEGPVARVSAAESADVHPLATAREPAERARIAAEPARRQPRAARGARGRAGRRGRGVPLPANWGGYRLAPESFEFWQHRDDRLHDRLVYRPSPDGGWTLERLAP